MGIRPVYTALTVEKQRENATMTTFDLVAILQVRENYGAHQWDGNGECPQYWKSKGSEEQVIATDLTLSQISDLGSEGLRTLVSEKVVQSDDEYYQTYLIDWELVCFDRDLLDRVSKSHADNLETWGTDPYIHMSVANDLCIPECAAQKAMEKLGL